LVIGRNWGFPNSAFLWVLISVKLKLFLLIAFVASFLSFSQTSASIPVGSEIDASNILKGGPYFVLSAHGVPNGQPCDWYTYATTVGLPYCAHPGVDISANYENLYAATDGVVEFAGPDAAYWPNHVDIRVTSPDYLGELHIYGHMSQVFVATGQVVKKGDLLGVSGEAGGAPHVHFERRTAPNAQCAIGCAIDPEPPLHGEQGVATDTNSNKKPKAHADKTAASDPQQSDNSSQNAESDQPENTEQGSNKKDSKSHSNSKTEKKSKSNKKSNKQK
jgi:hypothetical protein